MKNLALQLVIEFGGCYQVKPCCFLYEQVRICINLIKNYTCFGLYV